jgi:uncharacterized protein (TIGR02246 family)
MASSDEQQIRDLVSTCMSATRAGDVDKVLSLMADDVVFLVTGQAPFGKREFERAMRRPPGVSTPSIDGQSEIEEILVFGDWAWMRTRLTVVVTHGGKTSKRAGHTLSVLKKSGGKWLLARDANLLSPVEA